MKNKPFLTSSGILLNTLAESGTTNKTFTNSQPLILVRGNGTELNNKGMERRAKSKTVTQKTMLALIDVATAKGAKDRVKAYWNTFHCQNLVYTADGKLYGSYCKNRFCTLCSGIRKAELINKYLPVIQTWKEPYFITLTVKAIPAYKLQAIIKEMIAKFRKIKAKYRKRSQRGNTAKLIGLKTLECNFNPMKKTYNPRFHLIVPSKQLADLIVNEWLSIWTKKYTHRDAQHYRKVNDKEKDLIEVIKYGTKIFTAPGVKHKSGKVSSQNIYAAALDNIYQAMKGQRIFDRFGFNLPKEGQREPVGSRFLNDYQEWKYDATSGDWLAQEHESTLVGYTPSSQLMEILEYNIDTTLE